MHCVFCYQNPVIGINPRIQVRKGLISYYKTNGITSPMEEVNNLLKRIEEKQPSKKITNPFGGSISNFFPIKDAFKKDNMSHNLFLEDLGLLIVNFFLHI